MSDQLQFLGLPENAIMLPAPLFRFKHWKKRVGDQWYHMERHWKHQVAYAKDGETGEIIWQNIEDTYVYDDGDGVETEITYEEYKGDDRNHPAK